MEQLLVILFYAFCVFVVSCGVIAVAALSRVAAVFVLITLVGIALAVLL